MEKLKAFLIKRLILVLALISLAESGILLLVRRLILPYAASIAQYEAGQANFSWGDLLSLIGGLFAGHSDKVMLGLLPKSGVVILLTLSLLLILLPLFLGILWYARGAVREIDALEKIRDQERASLDAERNLMFSDFAHDLRTPIMTISGYAGALADGVVTDPEKEKDYLETIRRKAGQMSELINLLFDYTKLGSVNFQLKKAPCDLHEVLREAAGNAYDEIERAEMDLLVEIPEEPYIVSMDAAQVSRVLNNLLINAVRHNPAGTHIAIGVRQQAGLERIAIADSGVKIEKDPDQLFQPFVKGDDSRHQKSDEKKGSGLGLSIAKKVCDMHGWQLELAQPFGTYTKAFILSVPERAGE